MKKIKDFLAKRYVLLLKVYYSVITIISPKWNTKKRFKNAFGRSPDLENPQSFCEKILKMKLDRYETDPLIRQCADKYAVREYIKEKGCEEILVPLLATYDKPNEIEWDKLPDAFAMKWNFGCGFNIICENKSNLDKKKTIKKLRKWRRAKYHLLYSEMQYKTDNKKIIIEKYLKPKQGKLPEDYKVYCFGGRAEYVMLCVGREHGHPSYLYFDRNFTFMRNFSYAGMKMPEDFSIEKPNGFDDMVKYADILSAPFPFVRADFYLLDGAVYFGELTFTPGGAYDAKKVPMVERMFGEMIQLP